MFGNWAYKALAAAVTLGTKNSKCGPDVHWLSIVRPGYFIWSPTCTSSPQMFTQRPGGGVLLRCSKNHMASNLAGDTLKPSFWMARTAHASATSASCRVTITKPPVAQIGPDDTVKIGGYFEAFQRLHYHVAGNGVEGVCYVQRVRRRHPVLRHHGLRPYTIHRVDVESRIGYRAIRAPAPGLQIGGDYSFEKFAHLVLKSHQPVRRR